MTLDDLLREGPRNNKTDKVLAAYQGLSREDKERFRVVVTNPDFTAAQVAQGLSHSANTTIDSGQITHFRRKLRDGKVSLD